MTIGWSCSSSYHSTKILTCLFITWLIFEMMLIVLETSFCQVACLRMCVGSCLLYPRWALLLMQRLWIRKGNCPASCLFCTYSERKIWSGGEGRDLTLPLWASIGVLWFARLFKASHCEPFDGFFWDAAPTLPNPLSPVPLTCAVCSTLSWQYCSFLSSWPGRYILLVYLYSPSVAALVSSWDNPTLAFSCMWPTHLWSTGNSHVHIAKHCWSSGSQHSAYKGCCSWFFSYQVSQVWITHPQSARGHIFELCPWSLFLLVWS